MKKSKLWLIALIVGGFLFVKYTRSGQATLASLQAFGDSVWNDPDVKKSRKQGAKNLDQARKAAEKFLRDARR